MSKSKAEREQDAELAKSSGNVTTLEPIQPQMDEEDVITPKEIEKEAKAEIKFREKYHLPFRISDDGVLIGDGVQRAASAEEIMLYHALKDDGYHAARVRRIEAHEKRREEQAKADEKARKAREKEEAKQKG